MAKHEKKHEHKRERGGETPGKKEDEFAEEKVQARKRGGRVHGMKAESRPDKRARGGSTSEPTSEANRMSKPSYEGHDAPEDEHGKGTDKG